MTDLIEDTKGKIRDLPIDQRLRKLLIQAGVEAGVQTIRVTSGGQCAKGTCSKRTGSTRHDLGKAADLEIWNPTRALSFARSAELPIFEKFVEAAARLGATGMGAGVDYMGEHTIHVGFGSRMVWGAGGRAANAPGWLREAAKEGWAQAGSAMPMNYKVLARRGLLLRLGPGVEFASIATLEPGATVSVSGFDGAGSEWAKADLHGDGLIDGHVHKAFLALSDPMEDASGEAQDDCSEDFAQRKTHRAKASTRRRKPT